MNDYNFTEKDKKRFWAKVRIGGEDECWEWQAGCTNKGYGEFWFTPSRCKYRKEGAHRISWVLSGGVVPDGLFVLHSCDNRRCVNPRHLFVGTKSDNSKDATHKGKQKNLFTVGHPPFYTGKPTAKLSLLDVKRIRSMLRSGELQRNIALSFDVCPSTISRINTFDIWKEDTYA